MPGRRPEPNAFPPVERAGKSGLLAVGGDLLPERLLTAYRAGIFPWYSEGEPILWWSPDPRFVLFPEELHVSRSLRQFLQKGTLQITLDRAFPEVIDACRVPRPGQNGTWITAEMAAAYCTLHDLGYAHSIEAWCEGSLVGGLYGVSLGRAFFGESMFSRMANASKAALVRLVEHLRQWEFHLIDCQVESPHLATLGARSIPRRRFGTLLRAALVPETCRGNWGAMAAPSPGPLPPKRPFLA